MKRFFLALALVTVSLLGYAQSPSRDNSTFAMGIKADFEGSKLNFGDIKGSFEPGFSAGVFFRFGKTVYFQPEVLYAFRSQNIPDAIDEAIDAKNHYLNIPLFLGGTIVNNKNFKLRLFVGPEFGFLVGTSYESADDFFSRVEYGGTAGLGIDFWRFTLDAGYNFSFAKNKFDKVEATNIRKDLFRIGVGFKIFR